MPYTVGKKYTMKGVNNKGDQCSSYDLIGKVVEVFVDGVSIGAEAVTADNRMSFALVLLRGYEFTIKEVINA